MIASESLASPLAAEDIALRLGLVLLLVLANGFFVAAEFALVGSRRTRIDALATHGNQRAKLAQNAIRHLDHYISGTQLGITLSSLALGWIGENTLASVMIQWFDGLPHPWSLIASHAVASTIAFALITFLHIVLGELAPKSLALLFPESVSMWTAGPLMLFSKVFTPFIVVLNGSANLLLRAVGLRAPQEAERVHRPEEIELLLDQSLEHGFLSEEPVEMIRGVFDLSERTAAEVMTPRTDIVAVPSTSTIENVEQVIAHSGHSRVPVYEGTIDQIKGVVLARDLWRAHFDRRQHNDLGELIRPVPYIPESKNLEHLLREMQKARTHLVIVLDEYGGTAGLVTVEDVMEQIVGDIADEHETQDPDIQEDGDRVLLAGRVPVAEVNDRYALRLPQDEYTTVAGYIVGQLGRVAEEGEEVSFPGGRFRVLTLSGRRIERVSLERSGTATEAS